MGHLCRWTDSQAASKSRYKRENEDILSMISDAAVRGIIVHDVQNSALKNENTLLKKAANVVIDKRPFSSPAATALPVTLLPMENEALAKAISDDTMQQHGWQVDAETDRLQGRRNYFPSGVCPRHKKSARICRCINKG